MIEIEPGQLWRSFPESSDAEVDAFRDALRAAGGSVSIVGGSLDDWLSPTRRRDDAERFAFLLPQLQAAHRVGAAGLRLPIGQAGEPLLRELLPVLHDLDLVLYEEIQGQQTPDCAGHGSRARHDRAARRPARAGAAGHQHAHAVAAAELSRAAAAKAACPKSC